MQQIRRFNKAIFQIGYALLKINWWQFFKLYSKKANIIIYSTCLAKRKIATELICWDLGYINYCIKAHKKFRIVIDITNEVEKTIFWSPSKIMGSSTKMYVSQLLEIAKKSEAKNNKIYPNSYDLLFFENKAFMYQYFINEKLTIPETFLFTSIQDLEANGDNIFYPILLKGEHSAGGEDVFKMNSKEELLSYLKNSDFLQKFNTIIVQKLLNIRKDLRVAFIGDEVVVNYWRINPSKEWKMTSTSQGSYLDFENYPTQWHQYFVDVFKKTNLTMGAFDIAWEDDEINTTPYVLEVGSRFGPNPTINLNNSMLTYSNWKKKIIHKTPYWKLQNNQIFNLSFKYCTKVLA